MSTEHKCLETESSAFIYLFIYLLLEVLYLTAVKNAL